MAVTRRTVLKVPFVVAAASLISPLRLLQDRGVPHTAFADFADRWIERAQQLRSHPAPIEDAYLHEVCAWLAGIPVDRLPRRERTFVEQNGVASGPCFFGESVFVIELELSPGSEIVPHNHGSLNVITLGVEGEAEVTHYDTVGEAPDFRTSRGEAFRVRETRRALVQPGVTSHLTRARDNIHTFVAGEAGARILDFNTTMDEDANAFSYVAIGEVVDADRRVHEAAWLGKELP